MTNTLRPSLNELKRKYTNLQKEYSDKFMKVDEEIDQYIHQNFGVDDHDNYDGNRKDLESIQGNYDGRQEMCQEFLSDLKYLIKKDKELKDA